MRIGLECSMTGNTTVERGQERPSIEDWILNIVNARGAVTLDQFGEFVSSASWASAFLAVDRLSRSGEMTLRRIKNGDYQISSRYRTARSTTP